ncbi:SDR family oxidoreductase [Nodularia sp. UHCC 0506]|uniref:SDR family oxidoreductase n=1 Tax=Nodularia sp. UHCC 0506 TaxID=3110243 RepID=UPI002B1EE14C|nr:SDR family oxidoreductase [Nodularia sp. UHCC 0506]MEA5515862.1 SDR family oxidoreductase [Nodularia sp. UHCC 0506]
MIVITAASGQLGRLVLQELLKSVPANELIAAVRNPEKVSDFASLGVQVRQIDYTQPQTLDMAFAGADKVLLISSSEIGSRFPQHTNVINACKKAGVKLLAYTSLLHADSSPLPLAAEHQQTEAILKESGVPYVILRNGWYTENYTAGIPVALEYSAVMGCAGEGKIASAARADYAAAAATILLANDQAGKVYELAGDVGYTLSEFAAELSQQSGKQITYQQMPEDKYIYLLKSSGLPEPIAVMLAESETGAAKGGLFDASQTLSRLIGRPSTPLSESIQAVLEL